MGNKQIIIAVHTEKQAIEAGDLLEKAIVRNELIEKTI